MWSVPPPSLEEAREKYDATRIDHPASLPGVLETVLKAYPDALFHTLPKDHPHFPKLPSQYTDLVLSAEGQHGAVTDAYLLSALHHARLTKDAAEIEEIRRANAISSRSHEVVMRVLGQAVQGKIKRDAAAGIERPLLPAEWLIETEGEAEAIFVASCRREG
jgi:Xaa-Pro dipeptidase